MTHIHKICISQMTEAKKRKKKMRKEIEERNEERRRGPMVRKEDSATHVTPGMDAIVHEVPYCETILFR